MAWRMGGEVCRWCQQGECWTHGVEKSFDDGGYGKGGSKGCGKKGGKLDKWDRAEMMEMMQMMMTVLEEKWPAGKGKGKGKMVPQTSRPPLKTDVCSIHGKNRSVTVLEDDGLGGLKCKDGSECQIGQQLDQSGHAAVSGVMPCSVHGKNRSLMSLEDDSMGGMKCKDGMECQMGSRGGIASASVGSGTYTCSVHGKQRSMTVLMSDGMGGFQCKDGFQCQMGSRDSSGIVGGGGVSNADGPTLCMFHGKQRSAQSLEPFMGGFKCKPGFECKIGNRTAPY